MPYHYVRERVDYSDFASGSVFVTAPGQTGFPVRLASELFQRCLARRKSTGLDNRCTVYDPCCGSAYLLSTLAYLHGQEIGEIVGSDVDQDALGLAERNLTLLTREGLEARIARLQALSQQYGKESHAKALHSAERLRQLLEARGTAPELRTRLFRADATRQTELLAHLRHVPIDIVITDLPYGRLRTWQADTATPAIESTPVERMLTALAPLLSVQSIVAIAADKTQKITHPAYRQCEAFQVGKRRMTLLQPLPWSPGSMN